MADTSKADIVMKFVAKGNGKVWAESRLGVLKSDKFMDGFEPILDFHHYSNFFEVTTFNFAIEVKPQDQGVGALSQHGQAAHAGGTAPTGHDPFSRWRSAKADEYRDIKYPIEFDTFTFSRFIDGASPIFFAACCNQESFESATLVRRVSAGIAGGTDRQSIGFLRIDFRDVLLTGLAWDDGDMVTERCTFICKAMRIRYKPQRADGTLMPPAPDAVWDQMKDGHVARVPGAHG